MKFKMLFIVAICSIAALGGCNNQLPYDESGSEYESTEVSGNSTNIDEAETNIYPTEQIVEPTEILNESVNQKLIYDVKKEMEEKGWKNITVDKGWGDWNAGGYRPPHEEETKLDMYTLRGEVKREAERDMFGGWGPDEGSELSLEIIIQIVFDEENPNGYIYNVIYTSDSGRDLYSDSHINDFFEDNEILSPELEDLWEYMYSY